MRFKTKSKALKVDEVKLLSDYMKTLTAEEEEL
jgi:hypothetical protein